jgi:hypothetical protein
MKTKYLKQFESYHSGEMEPLERESFERSLLQDPVMNGSFQEFLSIYDAIGEVDSLDLRTKLKEIREEKSKKKNGPYFLSQGNNWMWMAALITVILSFTVIVTLVVRRIEAKEQLANEYSYTEKQDMSALDRELVKFAQRNMDFKLECPGDSVFLSRKDPLLFKWTVNSTNPLILELIDWKGKIVFSSETEVSSPYMIKQKLPGGIIVFRFRTETEAYHLGFLYLR